MRAIILQGYQIREMDDNVEGRGIRDEVMKSEKKTRKKKGNERGNKS